LLVLFSQIDVAISLAHSKDESTQIRSFVDSHAEVASPQSAKLLKGGGKGGGGGGKSSGSGGSSSPSPSKSSGAPSSSKSSGGSSSPSPSLSRSPFVPSSPSRTYSRPALAATSAPSLSVRSYATRATVSSSAVVWSSNGRMPNYYGGNIRPWFIMAAVSASSCSTNFYSYSGRCRCEFDPFLSAMYEPQ
jgi:hypothetical protein